MGNNKARKLTPPPTVASGWKAMGFTKIDGTKVATLADIGCTKSCLSKAFPRKPTKLYKRYFRLITSSASSSDGSRVTSVGIVNISFRVGSQYRKMIRRVVRKFIHDKSPRKATRDEGQDMGDESDQPGLSTNQPPYQPFLVVSDDPDSERNASGNSQPIPTITLEQPCDTEMDIFYTQ